MRIWQVLPTGPVGYGYSPYQSSSTSAGNPYFIDLPMLKEDGILPEFECNMLAPGSQRVDFVHLCKTHNNFLRNAFCHVYHQMKDEIELFAQDNSWLRNYALYVALEHYFDDKPWTQWPDNAIRFRKPQAIRYYTKKLEEDIHFHEFIQHLFFKQWHALKTYANENGILIFGDMPIYVAMESADTWVNPDIFQLDDSRYPVCVAGVPPDYFSRDGQLWGNPLYDWKELKKTGYSWWIECMRAMSKRYDIIRIDHFIGFAKYYSIDADAKTARIGKWRKGPGMDLFHAVKKEFPGLLIVAEDLGVVMRRTKRLLKACGYPGMKVLQFAFDTDEKNPHLPHNISSNSVLYMGTHDNDTTLGWQKASEAERRFAAKYLQINDDMDICWPLIEAAYQSKADTVIIPMQDFLALGSEARMNTPGTVGDNWEWRMLPGQLTDGLIRKILRINQKYQRAGDTNI